LFGPLLISQSLNKHSIGKAWGVIFLYTSTSLAHVEIAETYSTKSFLMAVRRFRALHWVPKRFQYDQGTQLVAASTQMATWDWSAVQLVNSRPTVRDSGDPETGGPITPLHLLLGRVSVEVPKMRFHKLRRLTQRLQFVAEAKEQFWAKWMRQVFSGRMLSHKWTKTEQILAVGEVVYLAEAKNDDPTYRTGVVEEVKPGKDGCVRTISIRYTNPGKSRRSDHLPR
jgi:hypothetical protein